MKMLTDAIKAEFYQALINNNSQYEGTFYVGVKTTGVFCRPTCRARKPKFENCEFYKTAEEALLASFRPCKRCRPLSHPNYVSDLIRSLVEAVEATPERRWKSKDFEQLAIDSSTVRRQFKRRFGMTFVQYARARRIGFAIKQIRAGNTVTETQLDIGYESSSGFRDAFAKIMGTAPTNLDKHTNILKSSWLDTPLGPMLAISDEEALYLLEFVDRRGLEREIEKLRIKTKASIIPGVTIPLTSIEIELKSYFNGNLKEFKTPIRLLGTVFQKLVWDALITIPYGETRSYADQAILVGNQSAYRAVANANGTNQISIVIPCHRIINSNGALGGYGGGITRKKWLLALEKQNQ